MKFHILICYGVKTFKCVTKAVDEEFEWDTVVEEERKSQKFGQKYKGH